MCQRTANEGRRNMNMLNEIIWKLRQRFRDDAGANLVEYGMLVAFIAVIVILAVTYVGEQAVSNIDVGSKFP